jgi:hypothetical protein
VPRPILDRLDLAVTRVGRTLANIPPAAVYRIEQRRAGSPAALHAKYPLEVAKRLQHRAAPSLLHAGERPAFIQESIHGIRSFPQRQQGKPYAAFQDP